MINQVAYGVSVLCNTSRYKGTDYGMDATLSGEMVVGCVHKIVGQSSKD